MYYVFLILNGIIILLIYLQDEQTRLRVHGNTHIWIPHELTIPGLDQCSICSNNYVSTSSSVKGCLL